MVDIYPVKQFTGRVTKDPEIRETSKGNVMVFGLAFDDSYGEGKTTTFLDINVWNEGLIEQAQEKKILKGSAVTVEGGVKDRGQYNDQVNVTRLGLVEWLPRSKRPVAVAAAASDIDF